MAPAVRTLPTLVFSSPRKLPRAEDLAGRIAVLDIAFAAAAMGTPFETTTGRLIADLGERLAIWVDHHDHELHAKYRGDDRFVLSTKAEHGACPEMITESLVASAGPVDTIVCHLDLDGLYSAAKWIRGGHEPYPNADADARLVDTRMGRPGPIAFTIDMALRAHFRDVPLKHRVVQYLVQGCRDAGLWQAIEHAAADYRTVERETKRLAALFQVSGQVAFVDAREARGPFDKTELLLAGQERAPVAIVRNAGMITVAASFTSGYDFLRLFRLEGGMPTRVSLPDRRLDEVIRLVNQSEPKPS